MVKIKKPYFIILAVFLLTICSICYMAIKCHHRSGIYTYYFKDIDFKFQVLEKDTCDVLILSDGDSVFYSQPLNGDYLGVDFFLSVDSNVVCLGPNFPIIYHMTENKYVIRKHALNLGEDSYAPFENEQYWSFYGGCDQGRYTFGVMRNKKFDISLEPLEW